MENMKPIPPEGYSSYSSYARALLKERDEKAEAEEAEKIVNCKKSSIIKQFFAFLKGDVVIRLAS